LAQVRWPALCHRTQFVSCILYRDIRACVGCEDCLHEEEQEAARVFRGGAGLLCVLETSPEMMRKGNDGEFDDYMRREERSIKQ
jgi:hypothetical protein